MDNPSKYDEDDRDLIERMYEGRKKIEKELSGVSQQQFKELVEKYWEHEPSKPPARPKHVTHEHRRREPELAEPIPGVTEAPPFWWV